MLNLEKDVPFDPGYNKVVVHFVQIFDDAMREILPLKNFNLKKAKYKMYHPSFTASLKSTLGFWVGCILWAVYIKYKFQNSPREITGNSLFGIDKANLDSYLFKEEFEIIGNYMKNYSRDVKYFLGLNLTLPPKYFEVFDNYKKFVTLNEHFTKTRLTSDVVLPKEFEKEYSDKELDEIYSKILNIINKGDLSEFLN